MPLHPQLDAPLIRRERPFTAGPRPVSVRAQASATATRLLDNPALISTKHSHSLAVQDSGGEHGLRAYMLLPVEQYDRLDRQLIRKLHGNHYLLILNVWMEPRVEVEVLQTPARDAVIIRAVDCKLHGSDLIKSLRLDERFVLKFNVALTWQEAPHARRQALTSSSSWEGWPAGQQQQQQTPPVMASTSSGGGAGQGTMQGDADLQVQCEVVGPFRALPRGVLEATGSGVLAALMRSLLPVFMTKLANDYRRWARDPSYRRSRASD